jgi:3-deoxy-D-manno-octulosonic-acid transferase
MLGRVYNALWYPALPFALIAAGGLNAQNRRQRLAASELNQLGDRPDSLRVWIHAASVGEIEAVRAVVMGLARDFADAAVFVTTMTIAGRDAARRRIPDLAGVQLAPLDCAALVRSFLARLRPRLVLIAETELWPNFFIESARAGAKVAVVNGRISARSMGRYRLVRPLLADALAQANMILAQTQSDADRYVQLGAARDRVFVTGNTKFDLDGARVNVRIALTEFAGGRQLFVAGSTAPGEGRLVVNAFSNLSARFPMLALVIAPRHREDAAEIEDDLHAAGLAYLKASALPSSATGRATGNASVLLLDTMGELRGLYPLAAIAFVGGSMTLSRGGQNLAEPASVSVPVLFGPHYENQRQVGDALLEAGAARIVEDSAQLESTCAEWLSDEVARQAAGARARQVMEQLGGGAAATLRHLKTLLACA